MSRRKAAPRPRPAVPAAVGADSPCPCGLPGQSYGACCGVFLGAGGNAFGAAATPPTAERLMRSRYTAFALGDAGYLLRSWHSRTRPARLDLDPGQRWVRLEILGSTEGGPFHAEGTVAFRAHFVDRGREGVLEEHSRFTREGGSWVYLDALE